MEEQREGRNFNTIVSSSIIAKIVVIGIIAFLLMIPGRMIKNLVHEREARRNGAIAEMSAKWGRAQVVSGPILTVPYETETYVPGQDTLVATGYLHFLPQSLTIEALLQPEIRKRGIFQASLYRTTMDIRGKFIPPTLEGLQLSAESILWHKAFFSMGMSDMAGIRQQITATVDGEQQTIHPGIATADVFRAGISIPYDYDPEEELALHLQLQLNGSDELRFLPLGQKTTVNLTSPWSSPSFVGEFLPVDHNITEEGFQASWQVSHFNRNYPQSWQGSGMNIGYSSFGVKIYPGTDIYQKTNRTVKYSLMFVLFSFTAFFLAEVLTGNRLHPVQYLLIGFAIICFYTVLLAFSEHVGFNLAFGISALAVIGLIGSYTRAIISMKMAMATSSLLAVLYGYLFVTLQLEDYALLMGSVGLFVLLGLVMHLTRRVDWYNPQNVTVQQHPTCTRSGSRA